MNAYELAEALEKGELIEFFEKHTQFWKVAVVKDSATILRQQANRIAELEKQGEPVAWMEYIQDEEWEVWYTEPTDLPEGHSYKPLYLAPQTKPLSDEEIDSIIYSVDWAYDPILLARAIEERHGIK